MAKPLSALSDADQNLRSPRKMQTLSQRTDFKSSTFESHELTQTENFYDSQKDSPPSSPFMADVDLTSQSFARPQTHSKPASPRKHMKEIPMLVPLTEQSLRHNDRLDQGSIPDTPASELNKNEDPDTPASELDKNEDTKAFNPDDTCFSAFSAVPNADMTAFARLTHSPVKSERSRGDRITPPSSRPTTPGTTRQRNSHQSPSPTPKRKLDLPEDPTLQLLEFTEQLSIGHSNMQFPNRGSRFSPSRLRSQPDLFAGSAQRLQSPVRGFDGPSTPSDSRYLANLLDFDLPPAPTPRSVPSITARELESLKAGFLSEVSSLKARLDGQDAEIKSLKEAKDDAEQRVGTASEELRDARDAKASLQTEKKEWQKRDGEMQSVLREVKDELLRGEKERKELSKRVSDLSVKLEDRERRLEDSEARSSEAESKLAGFAESQNLSSQTDGQAPVTPSNKAVEVAVDKVARELHALYKTKHETKVGALKKSYEARWEKRVKELQSKIEDLQRENEDLKVGRDATMSGVVPGMLEHTRNSNQDTDANAAETAAQLQLLSEEKVATLKKLEELSVRLETFESQVGQLKKDNRSLLHDLDSSRRENSELVAAAEQMLLLETSSSTIEPSTFTPHPHTSAASATTVPSLPHSVSFPTSGLGTSDPQLRTSVGTKASGLRGPGFGSSLMKRSTSGTTGVSTGGRSGIMSGIERMGRGRGGGE